MHIPHSLIRLTADSRHKQHHHAALVKRGGAVIARGSNGGSHHAEVVALSKIWPNKRAGTTLISIRITKGGNLSLALPCHKCMKFLEENGVKTIIYSTAAGTMKKIKVSA